MSSHVPRVAWQESLFGAAERPVERLSFAALRRDALDERSWVDVVPGWVPDHGELFGWLLAHAPWRQRTRRSFLLKPAAGGPVARRYRPGEGDLVVMGGACQHEWLHTVPREASASGARMSITLRHSRPGR